MSLRGALATWQSPGREDGRCGHGRNTFSAGDFSAAFGFYPHSGRNDIIKQLSALKPSPLGEGGTKCRMRGRVTTEVTVSIDPSPPPAADVPEGKPQVGCAGSASFAVKHYAAGRGRPALPTASPRIGYAVISTEAVAKWRPPRKKRYRIIHD